MIRFLSFLAAPMLVLVPVGGEMVSTCGLLEVFGWHAHHHADSISPEGVSTLCVHSHEDHSHEDHGCRGCATGNDTPCPETCLLELPEAQTVETERLGGCQASSSHPKWNGTPASSVPAPAFTFSYDLRGPPLRPLSPPKTAPPFTGRFLL